MQAKDFDIIYSPLCEQIFSALEFRPPGSGEWMWRIPGYFTINDLDTLLDKFKLSMENGVVENENVHELIPFQENLTQTLTQALNNNEEIDEVSVHYENEENIHNEENINNEENNMQSPRSMNMNENKNNNNFEEDEEENYFDVENDSFKKNEKKIDPTPTLPLATFEDLNFEENEKKNESKTKDWVDQTLVVPTINPE